MGLTVGLDRPDHLIVLYAPESENTSAQIERPLQAAPLAQDLFLQQRDGIDELLWPRRAPRINRLSSVETWKPEKCTL